jgi:heme/copper-type cytochrome/quinol oxidase subunit 1
MPPLTRWFIKSAMVYFITALLVGVMLMSQTLLTLPPLLAALSPVYFHLFMVGWVAQLIFGVGFWLFPTRSKEQPRGDERIAWATYWLLNVGLVLRVISEPLNSLEPQTVWGWLLALSAVLQWLAGMGFVVNTWGRVKGK